MWQKCFHDSAAVNDVLRTLVSAAEAKVSRRKRGSKKTRCSKVRSGRERLLMGSIHIRNVSKSYPIYARPADRLKELFTGNRRSYHRDFWALRDVSLEIPKGMTFGLVGENGSGKSTLLQLIAGILQPTSGEVAVEGRVSALLELGSGFNPEFTGRENVFLNGAILGLSKREMERLYPAIESFAEIGDFMHQPVKTYSSGMVIRLAFAVAISVDPDILLVDEALAVGDVYFRQRCMRKIHELNRRGVDHPLCLARHRRREEPRATGGLARSGTARRVRRRRSGHFPLPGCDGPEGFRVPQAAPAGRGGCR